MGGLQEHGDQTYLGSCKNKGLSHPLCATTSHTPLPFSVKRAWILTWIRWFFGTVVNHLRSLLTFQIKLLFLAPTLVFQFIDLSCGEQYELGFSNNITYSWKWWYGTELKASIEIYILKSETSKSTAVHHQPPYGFQNMSDKSIGRRLENFSLRKLSKSGKKEKNNIDIQGPPLDHAVMKTTIRQGLQCTGIPSSFLGVLLLAAELQTIALWLSPRFLKLLSSV